MTEANFDETVSKKGTVVLVDFWAPWCGPCREQGPIVEDIAKDYAGRAVVGKVNVDENEPLARRFGIEAIPTLIVFKDGKEVARKVGLTEKKELAAMLDRALGK
ncbi:MAG: thioredoxin [Armatimonadetes bacterium]|nr:thioredoxin [Armatimonadota bacterium]